MMKFNKGALSLRAVKVDDHDFFSASDIRNSLGIPRNTFTRIVSNLDEDEAVMSAMGSSGGIQNSLVVSESGLYHIIFLAKTDAAKQFRRWVTGEVLPSIRKTGSYNSAMKMQIEALEWECREANTKLSLMVDDDDLRKSTNAIFEVLLREPDGIYFQDLEKKVKGKIESTDGKAALFDAMRLMYKRNEVKQSKIGKWELS